ncbi:MAG: flagellar basal-body rod protein FlgF [Deltaproteobacteria bacterium]|nr:MAG: flagellar basal-body rod protein FlgF [Deltaproteobacteria bacterium]
MVSGKYSALAGAISREQAVDNIAQNLANVSTSGYKRSQVSFEAILRGQKQINEAEGINYTRVSQNRTDFSQGAIKETGNPLDLAIHGPGFFKVMAPGGLRYTRRGDFVIDAEGVLRTRNGLQVLGNGGNQILVSGAKNGRLAISKNGDIAITAPDGTTSIAGRIGVVDIDDSGLLQKEEDTTYSLKPEGQEVPIEEPVVISGSIESSNVNMVEEMTGMINSYRTFETYHKVINSYADIAEHENELGTIG